MTCELDWFIYFEDFRWSVGSSRRTHASTFIALFLPLELQQLLYDIVGVDLEMVIEVIFDSSPFTSPSVAVILK